MKRNHWVGICRRQRKWANDGEVQIERNRCRTDPRAGRPRCNLETGGSAAVRRKYSGRGKKREGAGTSGRRQGGGTCGGKGGKRGTPNQHGNGGKEAQRLLDFPEGDGRRGSVTKSLGSRIKCSRPWVKKETGGVRVAANSGRKASFVNRDA